MAQNDNEKLDYSFDLLYDIKNAKQLMEEIEYLAERLFGIATLCRVSGRSIDSYLEQRLKESKGDNS